MISPLVSVIVPAYNSEKYIGECLDSLINQTYIAVELIIVDDGSIDATGQIIEDYAQRDSRIVAIHKKNEGVSEARNRGINISKGEYLTFVDADDIVSKTFIEEAVDVIIQFGVDIVQGNTVYINKCIMPEENDNNIGCSAKRTIVNPTIIKDVALVKRKVLGNGKEGNNPLNGVFTSGPVCKLFSRRVIGDHRFCRDLKIGEDTVFNLEVLDEVTSYAYVDLNWYFYRIYEDSVTKRFNMAAVNDSSRLLEHLRELKSIEGSEYTIYLQERMIQQLTRLLSLYLFHSDNKESFFSKAKQVKSIICSDPWSAIIAMKDERKLPGNIFDKVLLRLCRKNNSLMICLWTELRQVLLKSRNN